MRPWLRNALTFGVISGVVTVLLNWLGNGTASSSTCQRTSSPLSLVAFLAFLVLMAAAGYMTTRAGDTVGMATVAGLVAAAISAIGTVIAIAAIVGSINPQCLNNTTNVSTSTILGAAGIVAGIVISLFGLGVGAGLGAIGGLIGRRPAQQAQQI
jgi:hypothetical protein